MKYNLMCIVKCCVVVLIFSHLQVRPVYAQDVSEDILSDSSIAVINRVLQTPRFVQNTGQWPPDIHYVARSGDGYIAFMTDSIIFHRFADVKLAEPEDDEESAIATGTLLSRKQSRPESAEQASGTFETRNSVLLKREGCEHLTPIALGQRRERFNFFPGSSVRTQAFQSPSFDTLVYRSVRPGYDLMIITWNARIQCMIVPRNTASEGCDDIFPDDLSSLATFLQNSEPQPEAEAPAFSGQDRIAYSTLLGGEKTDWISHIIHVNDSMYILCGSTRSTDFPLTEAAYERHFKGDTSSTYAIQLFFTAINLEKNEILFSTYFGGSDLEGLASVVRTINGDIVFAGSTWSDDMPTMEGAYQKLYRGNGDGYIAALDSTASRLLFCSYLGGNGVENLKDMKIDSDGNIVVTGLTDSWNFPTTSGVLQRNYGGGDDDIFSQSSTATPHSFCSAPISAAPGGTRATIFNFSVNEAFSFRARRIQTIFRSLRMRCILVGLDMTKVASSFSAMTAVSSSIRRILHGMHTRMSGMPIWTKAMFLPSSVSPRPPICQPHQLRFSRERVVILCTINYLPIIIYYSLRLVRPRYSRAHI